MNMMAAVAAFAGPLEQFKIQTIIPFGPEGLDLAFTNASLWMMISVIAICVFMFLATNRAQLVPGKMQSAGESMYQFIADMLRGACGSEGMKFFPYIFTLFMFILFGNLLGMLPYSFTFTSHIIVTFALAALVFIGVTILAIAKHGMHFFSFFVPPGAPIAMWPLLIPIEVISYLSRPISLSVRLFANMLAGHTLLKVIAGFIGVLGVFGVLPFALVVALTGLEILIAFLQAYVFAILTCLYINDALHLH